MPRMQTPLLSPLIIDCSFSRCFSQIRYRLFVDIGDDPTENSTRHRHHTFSKSLPREQLNYRIREQFVQEPFPPLSDLPCTIHSNLLLL